MERAKHKRRFIIYLVFTLLIMAAIFIFSAQDGNDSGSLSKGFIKSFLGDFLEKILPPLTDNGFEYDIRKYAHMFEFFCLGVSSFLLFSEVFFSLPHMLIYTPLTTLIFCFVYACSDEFHQRFVPGRAGRFTDVAVDSVGYICAVLIMLVIFILYRLIRDKDRRKI